VFHRCDRTGDRCGSLTLPSGSVAEISLASMIAIPQGSHLSSISGVPGAELIQICILQARIPAL
jgi:hypothetical protein